MLSYKIYTHKKKTEKMPNSYYKRKYLKNFVYRIINKQK